MSSDEGRAIPGADPGFRFRGPKNRVPGLDVAGTVAAASAGVTRFQVGDEVFGIAQGSFADYAAAQEDKLAPKPAGLSFEQAAVVAVSGLAAIKGLQAGRIARAGQKVLIIGASGGVGTYAVQLAKAAGATVTGVGAPRKPIWSARSAPTTSSTTPGRTSPLVIRDGLRPSPDTLQDLPEIGQVRSSRCCG